VGSVGSPADKNQTLSLLAHHAPAKKQALHSSHTNSQYN